ncbi:RHS repeat-associated core domain-containing protein [Micromonospora sp. LOL_024]|uniref:RHS repeat-associated core domain-containing protein n=1 Tax=Micromonospora sp. LOL_024 TaxID=3345412 RepID=UPI003A8C1280
MTEAADEAAAAALAAECGVSVEALSERTEFEQVVVEPSGSQTLTVAAVPQRVKRTDGSWAAIDPTLSVTGGAVVPAATLADVRFSAGGSGPLATWRVGGSSFTLSWPLGALPAPRLMGASAVYDGVLPGVNLHVTALREGFSHAVEILTPAAAANPAVRQIRYALGGDVQVEADSGGGLRLVDPGGETVAVTHGASMWDSSVDPAGAGEVISARGGAGETAEPATGAEPGVTSRRTGVAVEVDGGDLTVVADEAMLDDPSVTWPVFVDPPFNGLRSKWAYANNANKNWDVGNRAWVGRNDYDGVLYRSFFDFNVSTLRGTQILSAKVTMELDHSWSCDPSWVHLYRTNTDGITVSSAGRMNWSTRPLPSSHWLDSWQGNANEAGGCGSIQPDATAVFEGSTLKNNVQARATANATTYTVGLCACNSDGQHESLQERWKKFHTAHTYLIATYDKKPNPPAAQAFSTTTDCYKACTSPAVVRTTTPTLRANVSDPYNGNLKTRFEVRTSASPSATLVASNSAAPSTTAAPGLATWRVPSGLSNGSTYYWRAYSTDENNLTGDWSTWQTVSVDTSPPVVTSVSSAQYPLRDWGAVLGTSGTFALAGGADVADFTWSADGGSATTVTASGTNPKTASVTHNPTTDMVHTLSVVAKDIAGNISQTHLHQFWVSPLPNKFSRWKLDEMSGTTTADSGSGGSALSPGTLSGSVSFAHTTGDETCTRASYARNAATWMLDRVSQTEVLSGTCAAATKPANPATVLRRTRAFYDTYTNDSSFGAAPTRGNVVRTEDLDRFNGSTPVYVRTATNTYDNNGRIASTTDARGYTTTTSYTTSNGGLVTQTVVTNALNQATTTDREPAWDLPTKVTDPNGAVTDQTYDGLGRVTNVWQPGRNKANQTPHMRVSYLVRNSGGPTAVTTETLRVTGSAYHKSVELFDGFLRARQTQTQATGGGRLLTETFHNARGEVEWTSAPYYDTTNAAPSTTLGTPQGQIPSITEKKYDGAGRQTEEILKALGAEKWRTTTSYDGDRTHTTPPVGGTATTTILDAKGQASSLRQYKNRADLGSTDPAKYDETQYTYTLLGQQKTVRDPEGNTWSYRYDLRGREVESTDPDKGTTSSTFDAAGNIETTTSPSGMGTATVTLAYTYDELGRKTTVRDGSPTGPKRAEWVYDTLPNGKGKLTAATRYVGGNAWINRTDSYDAYGRPTSTSVVVPSSESQLCAAAAPNPCTYTTTTSYRANSKVHQVTLPAAADLPSERLTFGYNDVDAEGSLLSPAQIYEAVTYNKLGQLTGREFGAYGYRVAVTSDFDEPTRRLKATNVVPELKPEAANWSYDYDPAGNVTKIREQPQGQTADNQCYSYDYLRRMTRAWTPNTGDCAASPTVAGLGGPAPYWHSWTFDATGNRLTETRHATTSTTYTYAHPQAGSARPHTVTNVTATGGVTWSRDYGYDNAGNTITRPTTSGATQTLSWNPEGRVDSITEGVSTTSFRYDADGNRLTRTDTTGKTLYLPGGLEVRYTNTTTAKTATRYYSHAGATIAVRTSNSLHWMIADHHGTAELTINATTLAVAKRRTLPYGDTRGNATGTWPTTMDKGFVGGTKDLTGLTHIGAREYDPFIGRFISVDPIMDLANPQQIHGYGYANNAPATYSDPSGLYFEEGSHGDGQRGFVTKNPSGKNSVRVSGKPLSPSKSKREPRETPLYWGVPVPNPVPPMLRPPGAPDIIVPPAVPPAPKPTPPPVKKWTPNCDDYNPVTYRCKPSQAGVENARKFWRGVHRYGQVGGSACFFVCLGATYQDGYVNSFLGFGIGMGYSATAGGVSARPYEQSPKGWMGCFGDGPGGCYVGGVRSDGNDSHGHASTYHGGSVGVGMKLWVGATYNFFSWKIGTTEHSWFPEID